MGSTGVKAVGLIIMRFYLVLRRVLMVIARWHRGENADVCHALWLAVAGLTVVFMLAPVN